MGKAEKKAVSSISEADLIDEMIRRVNNGDIVISVVDSGPESSVVMFSSDGEISGRFVMVVDDDLVEEND